MASQQTEYVVEGKLIHIPDKSKVYWRLNMVKIALFLSLTACTVPLNRVMAEEIDLSKVDRSIRREPVWASGEPQYSLLVVSPEKHVWFVVDGDDLYMDINGNGDLTDPGEKLPPLKQSIEERLKPKNKTLWRIPDISGIQGEPLITNIRIYDNFNRKDVPGAKYVYFDTPFKRQVFTQPTFADKPADAPILYPLGPHRLGVEVRASHPPKERAVSNVFHVTGYKYVAGLGPGTRIVLETLNLDCRIEFPMVDGRTQVEEMRLRNFITGPYQTISARLPDGVDDDGEVKITLSMQPTSREPAIKPVVVEKLVTELRAVRRENK